MPARASRSRLGGVIVIPRASRRNIMKKVLEVGGFIAGAILVVFGVAAVVLAINGNSTVNSSLRAEKITGSADMTPAAIKQEVAGQAWAKGYNFPTSSVANKAVDNGS